MDEDYYERRTWLDVAETDLKQTRQKTAVNIYQYKINNTQSTPAYQSIVKRENSHITPMVYVIFPHDRVGMVLHPDTC